MQNTQLDRGQLSLCVSLIENGVNPEALAVSPDVIVAVLLLIQMRMRSKNYEGNSKTFNLILAFQTDAKARNSLPDGHRIHQANTIYLSLPGTRPANDAPYNSYYVELHSDSTATIMMQCLRVDCE